MSEEKKSGIPYLLGLFLTVGSWVFYTWRFNAGHLVIPYYLPILCLIGFVLMVRGFMQRKGILRVMGLVFALLLTGLSLAMAFGFKLPAYQGPAKADSPVPAFEAALADGTAFTHADLADGNNQLLVFYRGHW